MRQKTMLVSIACLLFAVAAWTASKSVRQGKRVRARQLAWSVGSPAIQGNLAVFPIYTNQRHRASGDYLTLEEALRKRLVVVKEMPTAEVNRVSVTNKAGKPVYLMAGDLLLGGQQDRECARDTVVPRRARGFAVEVFCVEHGRWTGSQHFSGGEVASGSLRLETQRSKEQQKVWNRVAQEARAMKAGTPSGTYRAVAGSKAMEKSINGYVKPLTTRLSKDKRVVGVVVAINGRVAAADLFADRRLFVKQLPKILKSYALDAVQQRNTWQKLSRKPKPTKHDAMALLREAEGGKQAMAGRSPSTVNMQREGRSTILFDAAPTAAGGRAGAAGLPAHRNIYRKQ